MRTDDENLVQTRWSCIDVDDEVGSPSDRVIILVVARQPGRERGHSDQGTDRLYSHTRTGTSSNSQLAAASQKLRRLCGDRRV